MTSEDNPSVHEYFRPVLPSETHGTDLMRKPDNPSLQLVSRTENTNELKSDDPRARNLNTLVGHLHYRYHPGDTKTAYAYMAAAKAEGIDYVYFTAGRVDLTEERITGWVYEQGQWVEKLVRFPDAIYNEAARSEKLWPIIEELQSRIPFTSHPIGDKMSVYERVYNAGKFRPYLIPTKELKNVEADFCEFLNTYCKVIVKPLTGAKGYGVIAFELLGDERVRIIQDGQISESVLEDVTCLVKEKQQEEDLLVQKYITCVTKSGQPYDFRIHVQKNGDGKWVIASVYHRIAGQDNITSNLSSGGCTGILDFFLKREFAEESYNMRKYLEQFGLQLAAHMDDVYQESFDELGIDVGIDCMRKAWIYEVNWKPGSPPNFYLELDVPRNSILYAAFLAKQRLNNTDTR